LTLSVSHRLQGKTELLSCKLVSDIIVVKNPTFHQAPLHIVAIIEPTIDELPEPKCDNGESSMHKTYKDFSTEHRDKTTEEQKGPTEPNISILKHTGARVRQSDSHSHIIVPFFDKSRAETIPCP
jgi:hypothetical protein